MIKSLASIGAVSAAVLVSSSVLAGTGDVFFLDGFWTIQGSSFWDPNTSIEGDEEDDSASASDGLLVGETSSDGGGGTSSGPFLGSYDWQYGITRLFTRGADEFAETVIDMSVIGFGRRSNAPGTDGFVAVTYSFIVPITFQIFSDSTDYLPFVISDTGTHAVTFEAVDTGDEFAGDIDGSTLKPGIYQMSFFLDSPPDPIVDGETITETAMIDFQLRILPAPHTLALVGLGAAPLFRRRR